MNLGEREFEIAERLADRERQAGVARSRAALNGAGRFICEDCGAEISEGRRQAMPNARDCIDCATFLERSNRRSA